MTMVKAILLGVVVAWVFAALLGLQGPGWGHLNIHLVQFDVYRAGIESIKYYWSWPIFFASTGIAWGIMKMME
jgi:hypothetical protein